MITRLKVNGFKNLVGVDIAFGPFTCIAGPNGVGKSNLFDVIRFLSALADKTLLQAAMSVRNEMERQRPLELVRATDIFTRLRNGSLDRMSIQVEMIVPEIVQDDLGQEIRVPQRHLRYEVVLRSVQEPEDKAPRLALVEERLTSLTKTEVREGPQWGRASKTFLDSTFPATTKKAEFIAMDEKDGSPIIKLLTGGKGHPLERKAASISRTILSTINTTEHPVALAARREMQSWRQLQLEPARLREPSEIRNDLASVMEPDGGRLAAVAYRLLKGGDEDLFSKRAEKLSRKLFELIGEIRRVDVDLDDRRDSYAILVQDREGATFRARELSDGTLRFLALAIQKLDPSWGGLLCMEEPENGIHPMRIPAILELLSSIAVDQELPVGEDNPLRQVIINTHSPEVVKCLRRSDLLMALPDRAENEGESLSCVSYRAHPDSWRSLAGTPSFPLGELYKYLGATDSFIREAEAKDLVGQQLSLSFSLLAAEGR